MEQEHTGIYNSAGKELTDQEIRICMNKREPVYRITRKGNLMQVCGAKKKDGTRCMKIPFGRGVNNDSGRCNVHGGGSKGAVGNKNNLKHGLYETLVKDKLEQQEQEYFENVEIDKLDKLDEEIKMFDIRFSRLFSNQQSLKGEYELLQSNFLEGDITKEQRDRMDRIETYLDRIEEQLTKIQISKAKLIETKHKIEQETNILDDAVEENQKSFIEAAKPTQSVWNDFDNGDDVDG